MTTLILGVPWNKIDKTTGIQIGRTGQSHSWETFVCTKRALGYELNTNQYNKLHSDIIARLPVKVVLLRNDRNHQRRAEAQLTELCPTIPTKRYLRYNISFENPKNIIPYTYSLSERLPYNGVRVNFDY
jgi:hypothetical protein